MHAEAYALMAELVSALALDKAQVLDVGSLNVNGTYRPLIEGRGWTYTGVDIRAGANVDVVADDPYNYPLADEAYDLIISGSTMEHVERPWLWTRELARLLKPGGRLIIVTHWQFPLHEHPKDCYRYLPDGMEVLLDEAGCLHEYRIWLVNKTDICAIARKANGHS